MVTRDEIEGRLERLRRALREGGLDGVILIHPVDIYYYSGTRQNGALWAPADGPSLLLVRKSLARAREEATAGEVRPFPPGKELAALLPASALRVGMTFDVVPVQQHQYYARLLPGRELVDVSELNRTLRSVKSPWELERLAEAGARTCEVFAEVPRFLRPGMREVDLAAEFEYRLRKAGGEGYVRMRAFNQELFHGLAVAGGAGAVPGFFDGAVTGTGLSSAAPHGASRSVIERDVPVMVDYTGIFDGYIVDMTRLFVCGRLDDELARAFAAALAIQDWLVERLVPGAICEELFAGAAAQAEASGFGAHFMGAPGENARFVGHGVGLELDELPVLAQGFKKPLVAAQTIAIEPKFVFPGRGVVGIENTFAVGEQGGVKLTAYPDDLIPV
ncbi:MAG: Xaa-Pro peptidase family protein [Anaeromyxobacteraceae bacterium]